MKRGDWKKIAVVLVLIAAAVVAGAWIKREAECPLPPPPQGDYQAVSALREELNDFSAKFVSTDRFIAVVPDDLAPGCYLFLYHNEIP